MFKNCVFAGSGDCLINGLIQVPRIEERRAVPACSTQCAEMSLNDIDEHWCISYCSTMRDEFGASSATSQRSFCSR